MTKHEKLLMGIAQNSRTREEFLDMAYRHVGVRYDNTRPFDAIIQVSGGGNRHHLIRTYDGNAISMVEMWTLNGETVYDSRED